jgi:hypothetical protein
VRGGGASRTLRRAACSNKIDLAAKTGPGRPRRIGQGGRRFAPTVLTPALSRGPWRNSLRAQRPLRSNSRHESVNEARSRARPREPSYPQAPRITMRRGPPGPAFAETFLVGGAHTNHVGSRQAVPGGGDLWGGCDARSGNGRACALRQLARRSCLNGGALRPAVSSATPFPGRAAQRSRRASGDRNSVSPRRVPPAATRGLRLRGQADS